MLCLVGCSSSWLNCNYYSHSFRECCNISQLYQIAGVGTYLGRCVLISVFTREGRSCATLFTMDFLLAGGKLKFNCACGMYVSIIITLMKMHWKYSNIDFSDLSLNVGSG